MGPGVDERPPGGGRGVVRVVAGDACSGYFLLAAEATVLAALDDAFPMLNVGRRVYSFPTDNWLYRSCNALGKINDGFSWRAGLAVKRPLRPF